MYVRVLVCFSVYICEGFCVRVFMCVRVCVSVCGCARACVFFVSIYVSFFIQRLPPQIQVSFISGERFLAFYIVAFVCVDVS